MPKTRTGTSTQAEFGFCPAASLHFLMRSCTSAWCLSCIFLRFTIPKTSLFLIRFSAIGSARGILFRRLHIYMEENRLKLQKRPIRRIRTKATIRKNLKHCSILCVRQSSRNKKSKDSSCIILMRTTKETRQIILKSWATTIPILELWWGLTACTNPKSTLRTSKSARSSDFLIRCSKTAATICHTRGRAKRFKTSPISQDLPLRSATADG